MPGWNDPEKTVTEDGLEVTTNTYQPFYQPQPGQPSLQPKIPDWAIKVQEKNKAIPDHVRVVQKALDLISWMDGALWCEGSEGYSDAVNDDGVEVSTDVVESAFNPMIEPERISYDLLDLMPNGEYQRVTAKVCAIGSIQLILGRRGGDEKYDEIIENLNEIAREKGIADDIVRVNDGLGRQYVQECFEEYIRRHGGSISAY